MTTEGTTRIKEVFALTPEQRDAVIAEMMGFKPCGHYGCGPGNGPDCWHDYGQDGQEYPWSRSSPSGWDVKHFNPSQDETWMTPIMRRLGAKGFHFKIECGWRTKHGEFGVVVEYLSPEGVRHEHSYAYETSASLPEAFTRALVRCWLLRQ